MELISITLLIHYGCRLVLHPVEFKAESLVPYLLLAGALNSLASLACGISSVILTGNPPSFVLTFVASPPEFLTYTVPLYHYGAAYIVSFSSLLLFTMMREICPKFCTVLRSEGDPTEPSQVGKMFDTARNFSGVAFFVLHIALCVVLSYDVGIRLMAHEFIEPITIAWLVIECIGIQIFGTLYVTILSNPVMKDQLKSFLGLKDEERGVLLS